MHGHPPRRGAALLDTLGGNSTTPRSAVGRLSGGGVARKNRFYFSGRLAGRKLAPAKYRLRAVPRNTEGGIGKALAQTFTIVR
ncbi:MAG: hypothetical protein ACJ760_11730 [Thermoleophilaceae bacterium]